MESNEYIEGFQFRSLIKVCWKGNLCTGRRSGWKKIVIELRKIKVAKCQSEICVATVKANIELLILEQEWMFSHKCVVLFAVG